MLSKWMSLPLTVVPRSAPDTVKTWRDWALSPMKCTSEELLRSTVLPVVLSASSSADNPV
jgi:hypothetical protein